MKIEKEIKIHGIFTCEPNKLIEHIKELVTLYGVSIKSKRTCCVCGVEESVEGVDSDPSYRCIECVQKEHGIKYPNVKEPVEKQVQKETKEA